MAIGATLTRTPRRKIVGCRFAGNTGHRRSEANLLARVSEHPACESSPHGVTCRWKWAPPDITRRIDWGHSIPPDRLSRRSRPQIRWNRRFKVAAVGRTEANSRDNQERSACPTSMSCVTCLAALVCWPRTGCHVVGCHKKRKTTRK